MRILLSSTDIIAPFLTSLSIRGNILSKMVLTNSMREDDNLREIKDGWMFPERAIISEKSRSCVNITLSLLMAVSMIVLSEAFGGNISFTRTTS